LNSIRASKLSVVDQKRLRSRCALLCHTSMLFLIVNFQRISQNPVIQKTYPHVAHNREVKMISEFINMPEKWQNLDSNKLGKLALVVCFPQNREGSLIHFDKPEWKCRNCRNPQLIYMPSLNILYFAPERNAASIANTKLHNQTNLCRWKRFLFWKQLVDDQTFLKKIWLSPQKIKSLFCTWARVSWQIYGIFQRKNVR